MTEQLDNNSENAKKKASARQRPWCWRDAFARAPLATPAIGLMVGVVIDSAAAPPAWACAVAFAAVGGLLVVPVVRRRAGMAVVFGLAVCCGALLHGSAYRRVSADHIVHHLAGDAAPVARVRGTIWTAPRLSSGASGPFRHWMYSPDRTSFLLEADSIERDGQYVPASGRVQVNVKEAVMDLDAGARVELLGRLYRPPPPDNPGQFDWARWLHRQRVLVAMSCKNRESVRPLDPAGGSRRIRWVEALRSRARSLLLDEMLCTGDQAGSLLDAIVLAQQTTVDPSINQAFIRIGCAHYLAASGFNVGMLALFLYALGRGAGLTRRSCAVIVIVATVAYALIAEPRPPIFRATVLALALCASLLVRRRGTSLNWLALATILNVLWRPTDVFDIGFQMSYACVAGLILLQPAIRGLGVWAGNLVRLVGEGRMQLGGRDVPAWRQGLHTLTQVLVVSPLVLAAAACLPSWPVMLLNFQLFSPFTWVNTAVVFIPVALVTCTGFAILLIGVVSPWLASALAPLLAVQTAILLELVKLLGHIPGVEMYAPSPPPLVWVVCYYAAMLGWIGVHRGAFRWPVATVTTAALAAATAGWLVPGKPTGELTMTVLAVDNGTSIVVELPAGDTILYDAGCSGSYDPGAKVIVPFLVHRDIRRIDAAFLSHPDLDHFGGLVTVLDRVPTKTVVVSPFFEQFATEKTPAERLLTELNQRGLALDTPRRQGQAIQVLDAGDATFKLSGATIEVLWPQAELPFEPDSNESSLVLRIAQQGRRILLTGDIGERAQGYLLRSGVDLRADVLLLPHHGGLEANTTSFVEAVDPEYVIQSGSRATAASLERLGPGVAKRAFVNTADDGAVQVVLAEGAVRVSAFRRAGTGPH